MKKWFCRGLLSLALTGIALLAYAQNPLKIGDALPKQFWETPLQMVNTPQKTTTLSADKDKLILLDFWNTWCSACILNFPKMEELQKQFGDKVKILAVSNQDRATLEKFFASKNGSKYNQVQSVAADKMMHSLFPHIAVPYIVWVKDGKLLNTTDTRQVSTETLTAVLAEKPAVLQTVTQMNRDRPLFLSEGFDRQRGVNLLNYSILIKGYIPDIAGGSIFRKTDDLRIIGCQFTNLNLFDIYFAVGYQLFHLSNPSDNFTEKRIILNVKNPERIKGIQTSDGTVAPTDAYSYEIMVPPTRADSLFTDILHDLSRYTGYRAEIKKTMQKCWVLRRNSSQDLLKTKGGELISTFPGSPSVLQNAPLRHMVNMINGNTSISLPLIDETGYTANVDIRISGITTPEHLNQELAAYGLTITEEERPLSMLIISDQK